MKFSTLILTIALAFSSSMSFSDTPFSLEKIKVEKPKASDSKISPARLLGGEKATIVPDSSLINFRAACYNIAYARGEKTEKHTSLGKPSNLKKIARLIKENKIDIIGLTEVSKGDARVLFKDQPKFIAKYLNFNHVTSIGFKVGMGLIATRGNAIVSRFPIVKHKNHPLYRVSEESETRGCLEATIDLGKAGKLTFLVTHLSLNQKEVEKQIDQLSKIVEDSKFPVILCGDFNSRPNSERIEKLRKTLRDASSNIDSTYRNKPGIKIDYLFAKGRWSFGLSQSTGFGEDLSDHAILFNDFWLLQNERE